MYFPDSKPLFILSVNNVDVVENDFRNPDWYLYNIFFLFRKISVWLWITFSITFKTSGKSETGRQFFGSVFEPSLYNGLSLAILQSKGNFEGFIERLHSSDIGKAKTTASSFKNLLDKLSVPDAFSRLVSVSDFKTSSSEVGEKVNFWFSVFRNLL